MTMINGMEIQINDLLQDTPKLKFNLTPETQTIREVNDWLARMFGYDSPYYRVGNTIITNRRGYEKLKMATKELLL